jgi:hypothetical protein
MITNQQLRAQRGVEPPAGPTRRRTERRFEFLAKEFTSVEQAVPVRLVYGRARVAGVQITPIFNFASEEVTTPGGKGGK